MTTRANRMFSRPTVLVSPAVLPWLSLGALLNIVGSADLAPVAVSIAGMVHAAVAFVAHGGSRISLPGVYMLGTALFVFFPGVYLSFAESVSLPYMLTAINVCYFGQILSYYLFWKPLDRAAQPASAVVDPQVTRWGAQMGFLLVVGGTVANLVAFSFTPAPIDAVVFAGTALMAVATFRAPGRVSPIKYALIGASLCAYVFLIFDGFGRLTIGALGIGIAMAATLKWRGPTVKLALIALMAPVILYLAASRVAFTATLNPSQDSSVTGLESILSPLYRFAELLELDAAGLLAQVYSYGSSFFTAAIALFPRALWPEKPLGFGAVLAELFRPDLAVNGHSEAALFHGEWLFAFGPVGLALMIPIVALAVTWLDRLMMALLARPLTERKHLLSAVALVILGAGLVDLVWGGAFAYASRAELRLIVVLVLFVLFAWKRQGLRRRRGDMTNRRHVRIPQT